MIMPYYRHSMLDKQSDIVSDNGDRQYVKQTEFPVEACAFGGVVLFAFLLPFSTKTITTLHSLRDDLRRETTT